MNRTRVYQRVSISGWDNLMNHFTHDGPRLAVLFVAQYTTHALNVPRERI